MNACKTVVYIMKPQMIWRVGGRGKVYALSIQQRGNRYGYKPCLIQKVYLFILFHTPKYVNFKVVIKLYEIVMNCRILFVWIFRRFQHPYVSNLGGLSTLPSFLDNLSVMNERGIA